ncbi:Tripeptidyl aminopeptidase precursor [Actinomadura rubteroloni]|uniref:Tripeptidyl aminopeptidase n=1 Tax=Actinomadura rubteroloni TaxID=1926885 RepID=A0A2P4UJN6_9ACTN|nr:Tripeptidyl aminopeptidase precursor [Actinomadura rubteroloni]
MDRVPAPVLRWTACRTTAECATARLPLDYDDPHGPTIEVALLRVRAKDPAHRLGTLFVNPGGPGDSSRDLAALAPRFLSRTLLDRFDTVGVDPRGVGGSRVRCFATEAEQQRALAPFTTVPFPAARADQRAWTSAARTLGRACSTTGRRIASAMSTAETARDMDVLRRALGDRKLTYLGESYGSYLGQVYANMFPDRVRAVAIDGIADPRAWVGTPATANVPVFDRLGSAHATSRALRELLERCRRVGPSRCSFADADPRARFDRLAARLRDRPLQLTGEPAPFTYADLIGDTADRLREPDGFTGLIAELTDLAQLTEPGTTDRVRSAAARRLRAKAAYDNHPEAQSGVLCTDSLHAASTASWPAAAAAADRRTAYFGAYWAWATVQCAHNTWTAHDEDVYRGPFDRRTAAPVLVVGSKWDPATSYDNAVNVARLLPNSRLVASDSWGHGALLTSACATDAIYGYLTDPQAPRPRTTRCHGDDQPFEP